MSVIRVEKTSNYTVMANYHFKEKGLSLKAKGIMSLMLSLPEDWDYTVAGLATLSKDGIESVRSALRELEKFHYLTMEQTKDTAGKFSSTNYVLHEKPFTKNPITGNPITGKPISEKRTQLNTKELSTKESSTNPSSTKDIYKESGKPDHVPPFIQEVVDYLNEKAGTSYKATTPKTQKLIHAREKEGFTLDDFKTVIDKKCAEWLHDGDMVRYLRPETLFGTKFESYLNQKEVNNDGRRASKYFGRGRQKARGYDAEAERLKWEHETSGWD